MKKISIFFLTIFTAFIITGCFPSHNHHPNPRPIHHHPIYR